MDGERFVSHLKALEIPGAETLVGSNYDWLFLTEENSAWATFMKWFSENILPSDVLTEDELEEYEASVSRGDILTSHQLEMEACFFGLPSSYNSSQDENQSCGLSPEEQKRLESQHEILTMRKNQLSTHKMELREEVYSANENVQVAEMAFKSQKESLLNTSNHLNDSHLELASNLDKLADIFVNFEKVGEEARFLSQLDLEEWYDEEAKFTEVLKAYITKQFREGVKTVASIEENSDYCLLATDNLDLHLVRGVGKAEYIQNVNELNRLDRLLRHAEERRLDGFLLQARRRAEVEEANRLLSAVHRGQFPTALPLIQQQTAEATESRLLVKNEREQQHQVLQSLVAEVAQLKSTRTISGNYQLKHKRHEYFLEKQKIVMGQLKSQQARQDWMKIALDVESETVSDILQVLKTINKLVSDKDCSYKERMERMEKLNQTHDKEKASGHLPPPLVTLSQILPSITNAQLGQLGMESYLENPVSGDTLIKQVKALNKALSVAREQLSTARNPQSSRLSIMAMNCELLEIELFGNAGSLRTLPFTWLDRELVDRYTNVEQEDWKLKQKVLEALSQYEEKKKVMQIEPTLRKRLTEWPTNILQLLG